MSLIRQAAVLMLFSILPCVAQETGTVHRTISSGGLARTYELHAPKGADPKIPLPLLMVFHGFTSSGDAMESGSGFSAISDQQGFIVAYPNALPHPEMGGNSWLLPQGGLADGNAGFITDVLADVRAKYTVDMRRVFVSGMSQGGGMCYFAAALYPDIFAAIAPVVVSLNEAVMTQGLPARPIPIMIMNGTADPLIPYAGGTGVQNVVFLSTPELAFRLAMHDGCFFFPFSYDLPDWNWFDGCTARVTYYFGGVQGSEVVLYTINGGGHTWPGSRTWLPPFILGNTCYDFDGSAAIWDFFKRHPMPSAIAN